MSEYTTRNLTIDETSKLIRQLTIALGSHTMATEALRVIANNDCGIFKAKDTQELADEAERGYPVERIKPVVRVGYDGRRGTPGF